MIMQQSERTVPQMEAFPDFLARHNLELPQQDEDQQVMLEEEFSLQEVKVAIQEATEVSATGPSGQTITFYKPPLSNHLQCHDKCS
jgi:hypothetical protein